MRFIALILLFPLLSGCETPGEKETPLAKSAWKHLEKIVGMGPRPAGSEALDRLRSYIVAELEKGKWMVERDTFTAKTPHGPVKMENILALRPGKTGECIVLASHIDTKILKDIHFVGANDSGSSTALLLALAEQLSQGPQPKMSIFLVFLDGEEAFETWTTYDSLYGSRHLAKKWAKEKMLHQIEAFILLDMVGDKDLGIVRESQSTPWLTETFRMAAKETGHSKYFFRRSEPIEDDHIPFLAAKVPAINLIDFDYGKPTAMGAGSFWHTKEDTLDKCSARSMGIVGEVVLKALEKIQKRN